MAQTAATLLSVLREAWTSDRIQKQFLSDDSPLGRVENVVKATMIGKQAQVPIHKYGGGGYTSVGAAGGSLNPATNQQTDQALYTLIYHWYQIALELSALNQSGESAQSIISGKDLELKGAISDMRRQATRQLMTNGDGIVAQCDTSGGSTVVPLIASPSGTAYGYDALVRNWLYPGCIVDIGTTADTDTLVTGSTISAFSDISTAPSITIGTSITTTNGTHFVYLANPNSTTAASPELNGLRNMINTTGALGGLNPGTAGQEFWKAALRDTSTTVFSLDLALSLQRQVLQRSGKLFSDVWTGYKQQANFYSLLQNQVRFAGDTNLGAGAQGGVTWNNMKVDAYPAILDSDWFCLTLDDFAFITGNITKPAWASALAGSGPLNWTQGSTAFADAVVYPFQIGLQRRNTHAAATALTA